MPMPCVFCRIRDGEIPAIRVAEAERAFAFLDANPIHDGHVLVVPRIHAATIFDIAEEDLVGVARLARRVAAAIQAGIRPQGLHVLQNNGRGAFQSVHHYHVHLIPRFLGDGKGFDWRLVPGDPARMRDAAERIRAALDSPGTLG
jgi:histidine triad (HIT) family protein